MISRYPFTALLFAAFSALSLGAQSADQHKNNANGNRDPLEQINSCDSACADQLARVANPHPPAQQKQSLPNVVEKSKQDLPWQALLAEALAAQSQSCQSRSGKIQTTKTAKENKAGKEMPASLADISARASAHIKTIPDIYVAEFMRIQITRTWNTPCPGYANHIPSRRDPEDADAQKEESATNDPPDDNH